MPITVHNPDRYMAELRQVLAQGRKRIGVLLGAGASASLKVDRATGRLDSDGEMLIPTIEALTALVVEELDPSGDGVITSVRSDLPVEENNIEHVLSRV
jgi:hypothetical protein